MSWYTVTYLGLPSFRGLSDDNARLFGTVLIEIDFETLATVF